MSENTEAKPANIKVTFAPMSPEQEALIAEHNAKLEAKAAAREAAAHQEQKDLIKEAIVEAMREVDFQRLINPRFRLRNID